MQKNHHKLKTETWKNKACRKSRKNSFGVNMTEEKSWNWKILSTGKSLKKYRKNISTSFLAKKSFIRKQGNKNAPGRNAGRGVWWLMATCHLISSECSYHRGSRYKNALIYWNSVLGKHVTILLVDTSNACTSQNVNKICYRFIQLIFVSCEEKECRLRPIRLPYQNLCSFK